MENRIFKLYLYIILFVSISVVSLAQSLNIKYFRNIDKSYYHMEFINEIPPFLVNMYDSYFEVFYNRNTGKIVEVILFINNVETEKWKYYYVEPDKTIIHYKEIEYLQPDDNDYEYNNNKNNELQSNVVEKLVRKSVLHYYFGKLVKYYCYNPDDTLKYLFEIFYDDNNKIKKEIHLKPDGSYVHRNFYFDNENIITHSTLKGVMTQDNNEKINIDEKWIYENGKLNSIEKYKSGKLNTKYYYDEYGLIIKKELYNDMIRIYRVYIYEYYYTNLNLSKMKIYDIPNPVPSYSNNQSIYNYSILNEGILVKEYYFYEDSYSKLYYNNNGNITKEITVNFDNNRLTEQLYLKNNSKKLNYFQIENIEDYILNVDPINEILLFPPNES